MNKRIKEKKEVKPLRKLVYNFENNLFSLEYLLSNLLPIVNAYDKMAAKELKEYKDKMGEIISSFAPLKNELKKEENRVYDEKISSMANDIIGHMRELDWSIINVKFFDQRLDILFKSSLMSLIAYFDFLFSALLHFYYDKYPQALNEEMTLSYGELSKCTDLNEAIHILIDQKIQSLLFKNFKKQIRFFKSDLKVNIEDKVINWEIINEAYQRRNILVHNDGIVNARYIKNVTHLNTDREVKEGERLKVSARYFLEVYMEILVGGISLIQNCWRKWLKDDLRTADSTLMESINKGLSLHEFEIAKRLGKFSKKLKLYDEENRNILDILYCYALKKLGIKGEFKKELKNIERAGLSFGRNGWKLNHSPLRN